MTKFQLLLATRSRIEYLETSFNVPPKIHKRKDKWHWILKQKKQKRVDIILDRLNKTEISTVDFVTAITVLYGDFSDRAAHRVPFPKIFSERTVDEIVDLLEVEDDDYIRKSLHVIIEPMKE